jgi:hypothetical protein
MPRNNHNKTISRKRSMANGYTKLPIWIPAAEIEDDVEQDGVIFRCEVAVIKTKDISDGVAFWKDRKDFKRFVIPFHKLESAYLQNKYYREKIAENKAKGKK